MLCVTPSISVEYIYMLIFWAPSDNDNHTRGLLFLHENFDANYTQVANFTGTYLPFLGSFDD